MSLSFEFILQGRQETPNLFVCGAPRKIPAYPEKPLSCPAFCSLAHLELDHFQLTDQGIIFTNTSQVLEVILEFVDP